MAKLPGQETKETTLCDEEARIIAEQFDVRSRQLLAAT